MQVATTGGLQELDELVIGCRVYDSGGQRGATRSEEAGGKGGTVANCVWQLCISALCKWKKGRGRVDGSW